MYYHVQRSPLYLLLLLLAAILFVYSWFLSAPLAVRLAVALMGGLLCLIAMSFKTLTVESLERQLDIRFGPVPLFGTQIPYRQMASVQVGRSLLIDGWGIHWIPFRGWTFNLWGFACVIVRHQDGRVTRIGTDDPEGLLRFLQSRIAEA